MRFSPIVENFLHVIHGADYYPEQWIKWKDTIWKEDMRIAKAAHINTMRVGVFSWSSLEPKEGEYCFEWLDEILGMMADNGLAAIVSTPSGARPAWMSKKYPEVLRVNPWRQRNIHGERHNHCLSSLVYREKTGNINTRLAERYKDHPALKLWHISNEYGGECHCPLCQEKFRSYLKDKYKTLDTLNEAWWTVFWSHRYSDWEEIESPGPLGDQNLHGLNLDWKRFTTEQFVDFYLHEIKPMREYTPGIPCTTNLMGVYPGIDYYRLAEVLDVVSWDNYPRWTGTDKDIEIGSFAAFNHDLTRGLKGKPFILMESCPSATNWQPVPKLRRPGAHMLQSMQAVAHGSDTVMYFQFRKSRGSSEKFHGAVVGHEGTENTRTFRDIAEVGERLEDLDALIGMDNPSKAGIIFDWNIRWALDDAKGFLQDKTDYEGTVLNHYRAFWNLGIPVDVIDSTRSFDKYDVLVSPMLYLLREGVADRINSFVENGGIYVATYATAYVNSTDLCFLGGFPGPLKECLGIWNEEIDALFPEDQNSIEWRGKKYSAFGLCELIHSRGADVLAVYGGDFYAGMPALTVNKKGKGKAYYIAARTGIDFLEDIYGAITAEAGVKPPLEKPLPRGINVQLRSDGVTDFLFFMNFTPIAHTVDTGGGLVELAPFGIHILERPASKK